MRNQDHTSLMNWLKGLVSCHYKRTRLQTPRSSGSRRTYPIVLPLVFFLVTTFMAPQYCEIPLLPDVTGAPSSGPRSLMSALETEIREVFERFHMTADPAVIQEITLSGNFNHVDPRLIAAIVVAESSGDPLAISRQHAIGLMQINAKVWARKLDFARNNPFDPVTNIRLGVPILSSYLKRNRWLDTALASYVGDADMSEEATLIYVNRVIRIFEKAAHTKVSRNPHLKNRALRQTKHLPSNPQTVALNLAH